MRVLLFLTLLCISLTALLYACSKEEKTKQFLVVEAGTKTPLQGVKVAGYTCLERDWIAACTRDKFSANTITDNSGLASFPLSASVDVIKVSKERYWDDANSFYFTRDPLTYMYPVATLKVHVVKEAAHRADEQLVVLAQMGPSWELNVVPIDIGQPRDTTIFLKARGNMENDVLWNVKNGAGILLSVARTPPVLVNGFDTAQLEIRY